MSEWSAKWSGRIEAFPGLQSIVPEYGRLHDAAKEHVEHLDLTIKHYFGHHDGQKHGSIFVEATTDPEGAHSAAVTIAAIPTGGQAQAADAAPEAPADEPDEDIGESEETPEEEAVPDQHAETPAPTGGGDPAEGIAASSAPPAPEAASPEPGAEAGSDDADPADLGLESDKSE